MARHLSVATAIEKNKVMSNTAFVILIEIDIVNPNTRAVEETICIAKNNENIVYNGQVYTAGNFDISLDQREGEESTVTCTARDPTRNIQTRMEAFAGGVLSELTMMIVNTDRLDKPPEISERFKIITSSTKDYVVTFSLGAENPLSVRYPLRMQYRDRCSWRFKGYGCGYAGADATCTYMLDGANGCRSKGNNLNFGGLPGLRILNL